MKKIFLPLLGFVLMMGCATKPVSTTRVRAPGAQDARRAAYDDFVAHRALELQQMGGPFKKSGAATAKALEEAQGRFGDVPADWTTVWTWGQDADKAKKQAEINDRLEQMAHHRGDG